MDEVQEVVDITIDSWVATSVWPIRKKGVTRTKATKTVRLAAASGTPIQLEGDATLEFVRDGRKCNMKFEDTDRQKTVGFFECECRKGKRRRVRTAGIVHREHEHGPEASKEQEARRVCGAAGRASEYEIDEDGEV